MAGEDANTLLERYRIRVGGSLVGHQHAARGFALGDLHASVPRKAELGVHRRPGGEVRVEVPVLHHVLGIRLPTLTNAARTSERADMPALAAIELIVTGVDARFPADLESASAPAG